MIPGMTGMGERQKDAAAIALLLVATILLRLTSFVPAVVDTDEGLYMVQAREWLAGGWPLVAAWDMHPIGAPALFAVAFLLFGVSVEAARLLGLICVAATACGLYGAARAARAPRGVGIGAGVLYAAHTLLLGGLCTNTELLIAPFVTGAMALGIRGFVRAQEGHAPGFAPLVAMGLLIGPALLVKQVVVPEGSLAFALLVFPAMARGLLPWRRALAMAGAYAALCAGPFVLAGAIYAVQGWLHHYLDGSLLAPFRYAMAGVEPAEAWRRIGAAVAQLGLLFGAAVLALGAWRKRAEPLHRLTAIALVWFAVTCLGVAGPGYFFSHYFLLWLPPLALLASIGAWRVAASLARTETQRLVCAAVVATIAGSAWLTEMTARFERGPGLMHRDPAREVAAALREVAGGGTALIANYHPSVLVMSGAAIATRFAFPPHLTGVFERLSDTDIQAELDRVLAARPRVIVVDRGWMHTMRPAAAAKVMRVVDRHYDLAASVAERRGPVELYRVRDQGAGNSAVVRPIIQ
jgi:4-amino-4-deoxy-L-arabinose transferase-like glycosyltransferase